jgi:hypothetical protein
MDNDRRANHDDHQDHDDHDDRLRVFVIVVSFVIFVDSSSAVISELHTDDARGGMRDAG